MNIQSVTSHHPQDPSRPQYYMNNGIDQVTVNQIGEDPTFLPVQMQTPASNAMAAEFGVIDTKNALSVHDTEKVERPTEAKKVFRLNDVKSVYKEPSPKLNQDFFQAYYGININKRNS